MLLMEGTLPKLKFIKKLEVELLYDTAIPFLVGHPKSSSQHTIKILIHPSLLL